MNEHMNDEGLCYCGSLDCVGHLRVMLNKATEQVIALESRVGTLEAIRDSYKAKKDEVREFIQASIDREDWTADELSEIFWEELAEILDLSLNLFEEKSITLTIEQAVTVKVKRGYDVSGYDFDIAVQVDGSTDEVEVLDYDSAEVTDWNEA
jgi:hypothetical protein